MIVTSAPGPAPAPTPVPSPALVPPRTHRTVFEAISDLSVFQDENNRLLSQLTDAQTTTTNSLGSLLTTLVQTQGTLTTTMAAVAAVHQQIADVATYWRTEVAGKPAPIRIEGPVHVEIEQRVTLGEIRRLHPGPLLVLLTLLHRIELALADVGIAEDRAQREQAAANYAGAARAFEEHVAATRHLKGLKPQLKGLALKLAHESKSAIDEEILEKLSLLHAISASAVALHAAHAMQNG